MAEAKALLKCQVATDQEYDMHVLPRYGRSHSASVECWCLPKLSKDFKVEDKARVWVHREQN